MSLAEDIQHCNLCAWRGTCQMKFNLGKDRNPALRCTEFTFDVTLKSKKKEMEPDTLVKTRQLPPKRYFSLEDE